MKLRVKTAEERLNELLSKPAIALRRTQCKKRYEGTKVEIWELAKNRFFLVWKIEGFFYGFEVANICYRQILDTREKLMNLPLDESGVAF
jgi:hypothetical protein